MSIVNIISTLMDWINAYFKKQEENDLQEQYNEIESNPVAFYNSHFGNELRNKHHNTQTGKADNNCDAG